MAESHVITALTAKRSELAGLLKHHQHEIKRLTEEVKALEAAIKIFEPDYDLRTVRTKPYRKKNTFFKPREANRLILETLRDAKGPISTLEIVERVAYIKGYSLDKIDSKAFHASIFTIISRLKGQGVIKDVGRTEDRKCVLWKITRT